MMKRILIPTDLSPLGDFAYGLANILAKSSGAEILTLSVIPGPAGAIYNEAGELMNDEGHDYSEWEDRAEKASNSLQQWITNKPDISGYEVVIGNINEAILTFSEKNDIDLIVMGTEGSFDHSIWRKGSHAEYISNHSEIPLLSLKCDRKAINLKSILLVSDFNTTESINLSALKAIQQAFDSKLVLLYVKTPNQNKLEDTIADDMLDFAKRNELVNFSMHIYHDNLVESGIAKFSAENDIDLIGLGSHQGFGISKLFKGSISDDVVNHLYHPILTFPLHKN